MDKLKLLDEKTNSYYLNLIIKKYNIKENENYSYNLYLTTYKYSEKCFNYIKKLLKENNSLLIELKTNKN